MFLTRVVMASALFLVLPALTEPSTFASSSSAVTAAGPALPSDFNGDGVEDRIIGVPSDGAEQIFRTGGVHVLYGPGPDGTAPVDQYFGLRNAPIGPLLKQHPGLFGAVMASGDFDRDGYADVAISVPGFDEPDVDAERINVGGVVVIYGTAGGLDPEGAQPVEVWSQDHPRVQGVSEDDDAFGSALAVGDFDGDDHLDLAVGIEGEQTGPDARNSGAVTVLFGNAEGLTSRDQVVDQDTRGILDASETGDWAGDSLAAGDFDADGVDDLALGVFSESFDGRRDAGAVNVIYGTRDVGLTGRGDQFLNQGLESIEGQPRRSDMFGATLAVGDHDGDGFDDLAVGAPEDRVAGVEDAGSVTVLPGSAEGVRAQRSTTFNLRDLLDSDLDGARFAGALATGDVDGDGFDELAIGAPWHSGRPGRVDVLAGGPDGLRLTDRQPLRPDALDSSYLVPGFETFGSALQLGEFDVTPGADLLVGMARADLAHDSSYWPLAGAAVLLLSRDGALTFEGGQILHQGTAPIGRAPGQNESFGSAVPGSSLYTE